MKIRKGDTIIVISGKDKGKKGKVVRALPREQRVIVEGINVVKRHQSPRKEGQKGQIIDKAMPMHVSNVMLMDTKTKTRTRVGYILKDEKKIRIAKKSGTELVS